MRADDRLSPEDIVTAIAEGRFDDASAMVADALGSGADREWLVNDVLRPAAEELGRLFEKGEVYLPAMVSASRVLGDLLNDSPVDGDNTKSIVIGTVSNDVHEIGKNLCASMARSKGYRVIDLGNDVPVDKFIEAAEKHGAPVIAVSSTMKSTLKFQKELVETAGDEYSVLVGGASCSPAWADSIGAAGYSSDCRDFVLLLAKTS